jgi:hypothetical protein
VVPLSDRGGEYPSAVRDIRSTTLVEFPVGTGFILPAWHGHDLHLHLRQHKHQRRSGGESAPVPQAVPNVTVKGVMTMVIDRIWPQRVVDLWFDPILIFDLDPERATAYASDWRLTIGATRSA